MKDRASSMERRSGRQASATDAGLTTTQPDTGTRVQAQLNPSSRDATQGPRSCGEAVRPWPIRKQGPYYRESWYRHVLRIPTVLHVFISRRVRQHTETFVINTVCIICRHNTADRSHFHESVLRKFLIRFGRFAERRRSRRPARGIYPLTANETPKTDRTIITMRSFQ